MGRLGTVVALLATLACGTADEQSLDYRPVPDQRLYAQVSELPGVSDVDVTWSDSFGTGPGYRGTVRAELGTDGEALLDQVIAILWQGKPGNFVPVSVLIKGDLSYVPSMLDLIAYPDYVARYGEHPGDGKPPE